MKAMLLASAMMVSAPVLAQDADVQESTLPGQEMQALQPQADALAEQQRSETPIASSAEIAEIVEAEFPKYDKSGTGEVNREEFGEWMVALRTVSEPGVDAQSAEVQGWVGQAFVQADADNSGGVTKEELTRFLAQGA